jgi:hypothetical protein
MAQFRDTGSTQGNTRGTCHVRHSAGEKASVSGQGAVKEGYVVNGRVLSEEDVLQTEYTWDSIQFVDVDYAKQTVRNLIATIRDRDRVITEHKDTILKMMDLHLAEKDKWQRQNALMLEALEEIADGRMRDWQTLRARDALAKAKGGDSQ